MSERACVVGAGIAGLTIACALERRGYQVRVLEREASLRTEGAGLTLWPNALRALDMLTLGDAARSCAQVLRGAVTLSPRGTTLARVPLAEIERRFGPLVSVRRPDLLAALRERLTAEIEFGTPVTVAGGSLHAGGEPLGAELVIGADGAGSVVRELVAPGVTPRQAGYSAWRGVAPVATPTPVTASETVGRGKRFGLVPLTAARTYWFAVLARPDGQADLAREFAGWHRPIAEVLQATPDAERTHLAITELPRLARWHRDNAVLVGDAAHTMTPNLGQGAAQALEDVAALVSALERHRPPEAFSAYVAERKRRAERVAARSRSMGRILQASHPITATARDALSLLTPQAVLMRQFGAVLAP